MKGSLFFIYLISLIFIFSACNKHEDFLIAIEHTGHPFITEPLQFNTNTPDIYDLEWDFGDGRTAKGRKVTHTYSSSGTYAVQLKAMYENYPVETTYYITVKSFPEIKLKRVSITDLDPLEIWDTSDGPDVFFTFSQNFDLVIGNTPVFNNANDNNLPYWDIDSNTSAEINDLEQDYVFRFFDKDPTQDQYMFDRVFSNLHTLIPFTNKTIYLYGRADSYVVKLEVDYIFTS